MVKGRGATTLIMAVVLLILSTLIIIFATRFSRMQEKATANLFRNNQAYEAAEAGLEYGLSYLQQNSNNIISNVSNGYIRSPTNSSLTNVTLANNSQYSVVYSNPLPYNYRLIQITATGKNSDNSSTRVISEQVQPLSILPNSIPQTVTAKGTVTISGNSIISNTYTNKNVSAGNTVSFTDSGRTLTSSGYSTGGSDIDANNTIVNNESQGDFFSSIFATQDTLALQSVANRYYQNNTSTDYSSTLNGQSGKFIWIDQASGTTATISGNASVGSFFSPVLVIVNGNVTISGNAIVYGYVYAIGASNTVNLAGNARVYGGMGTSGNFASTVNSLVSYNPTVISFLKSQNYTRYAKIPGSWNDF